MLHPFGIFALYIPSNAIVPTSSGPVLHPVALGAVFFDACIFQHFLFFGLPVLCFQ